LAGAVLNFLIACAIFWFAKILVGALVFGGLLGIGAFVSWARRA
jgi:hypothetical protein